MKRLPFLPLVLMLTGFLKAQDSTSFHFDFNHMALSVKDVNRSVEFYQNVLLLKEITNRTKLEGIRWFSFADGRELHLISLLKKKVIINKAVHLALATSQFDEFVERLDKLHIPFSDWPGANHIVNLRADGIKQIYFQDPDGYWIEVNSVGQH